MSQPSDFSVISKTLSVLTRFPFLFALLWAVSICAALAEGLSVSMLMPLLNADSAASSFAGIPVLGELMAGISQLEAVERIYTIAGAMFLLIGLRGVMVVAGSVLAVYVPTRIQRELMQECYNGIISADLLYLQRNQMGALVSRSLDNPMRASVIAANVIQAFSDITLMLIYVSLLFLLSVEMTVMALGAVLVIFLFNRSISSKRLRIAGQTITESRIALHNILNQTISGIKLIRLRHAESDMNDIYRDATDHYLRASMRSTMIANLFSPVFTTLAGFTVCLLLAGGAYFHGGNPDGAEDWIGRIVLFMVCLYRLMTPALGLNRLHGAIENRRFALVDLGKLLADFVRYKIKREGRGIQPLERSIEVKGLVYEYPETDNEKRGGALKSIDLKIDKGQMVAFVGRSGSGKSTLANLIAGFYLPTAGEITIDGAATAEINLPDWWRQIGFVTQQPIIFNDTVRKNLCFGLGKVPDDKIWNALKLAECETFIREMPEGLETMLGENGSRVSGGQQQRLMIARCILSDPELVILDEATANLDSITEKVIQRSLDEIWKNKTRIVIAHRLSTIRRADCIYVLNDGRLIGQGRDRELNESNPYYADLRASQLTE